MPEKKPFPDKFAQPGPIEEKPVEERKETTPKPQLGEKELKAWWKKITASDEIRKEELETTYKEAIDYVKSKQFPEATDSAVVVNYFAATMWIMINYVYAQTPEFKATGRNPIGEVTAPFAELSLNYYTKENESDEENKLAIIDSLLAGEGITLEALSTEITYVMKPKKETSFPEPEKEQGETMKGDKGSEEEKQKTPENFEYAEYIKKAMPVSFRISPKDFIKDTDAKSFKRARWCGRWIRKKPINEILDNPKWRNEAKAKIKAKFGDDTDGKTGELVELQIKRRMNGELQIWRLVLYEGDHDIYLCYKREEYEIEGFNYVMIQPKKLGDDLFGLSEFLSQKPIQDLINQVHSKMWKQMSKSQIQTIINRKKLTKKGKTALLKGEGIIEAEWVGGSAEVIGQAETSKVHPDLWRYDMIVRDIYRVVSGIGEAMRAGAQPGAETLGEVQMIQGGTNVILSGFAKAVRMFLLKQARKRLQIIRQLPIEEYLPIAGYKDKIPKEFIEGNFIRFSKKYVQGEYGLDLDIETMKARDEMQERAELKDMIATLSQVRPLMHEEGKRIKISKLVEDWLKKYKKFSVEDYIEDMNLRSADEENLGFLLMSKTGQIIPINPQDGENLEEHFQKHTEFMGSPLKEDLSTEAYKAIEQHASATAQTIQQKKELVARTVKAK